MDHDGVLMTTWKLMCFVTPGFSLGNLCYCHAVSPEGHIAGSFRRGHLSPFGYLITNTTYFRSQLFGDVIEPHTYY